MENKLIENSKEAVVLVGITAGIGLIVKKVLKKNVTSDPSSGLMNFGVFTVVMITSIFGRDYLIKGKYIPT